MNKLNKDDYNNSIEFWNERLALSDEAKAQDLQEEIGEDDWKQFAPSEKLFNALTNISSNKAILDYGCGNGWASIILAKAGCDNVTAVDVIPGGVDSASHYAKLFEVEGKITAKLIPTTWFDEACADQFDAAFCSNVLDVVPTEISDGIIEGLSKVVKKGGQLVIGMNYYAEPVAREGRNEEIKDGIYLFADGILRLVCRTDEEWSEAFSKYFEVEKIDHFAWPGEETERRRLFFLRNK